MNYVGKYFYEDLGSGWIGVFDPASPGNAGNPDTSSPFATGTPPNLIDLKVDPLGNLYYLSGSGQIRKISYSNPQSTQGIVDDGGPGYSESGTGWLSYPSGYGGDVRYRHAGWGADAATWQVPGLAAGSYVVQASWGPSFSDHATDATYRIYDGATLLAAVPVNQQASSSGTVVGGVAFQTLATVALGPASALRVVLGDDANGIVVADAIRVAPATSGPGVAGRGALATGGLTPGSTVKSPSAPDGSAGSAGRAGTTAPDLATRSLPGVDTLAIITDLGSPFTPTNDIATPGVDPGASVGPGKSRIFGRVVPRVPTPTGLVS